MKYIDYHRLIPFVVLLSCCTFPRICFAFSRPLAARNPSARAFSLGATTETEQDITRTDSLYSKSTDKSGQKDLVSDFCIATNEFFKGLVIQPVKDYVQIQPAGTSKSDILSKLTAPPEIPGIPRPVWLTILGSVPTALGWVSVECGGLTELWNCLSCLICDFFFFPTK